MKTVEKILWRLARGAIGALVGAVAGGVTLPIIAYVVTRVMMIPLGVLTGTPIIRLLALSTEADFKLMFNAALAGWTLGFFMGAYHGLFDEP